MLDIVNRERRDAWAAVRAVICLSTKANASNKLAVATAAASGTRLSLGSSETVRTDDRSGEVNLRV